MDRFGGRKGSATTERGLRFGGCNEEDEGFRYRLWEQRLGGGLHVRIFSHPSGQRFSQIRMPPNLKQVGNTKLTLKRLHAGYPTLSLHEDNVVYVMHTPDPDKDEALVIALDMRNKTLKDVADFGSGRPLGYTFTYLQSGISKHLNV